MEVVVELLEEREGRFAHQPQHALFGVLRGDLQPPGGVMDQYGAQIGRVVEEVVADSAADERLLDPLHGADLRVEIQQRPVVVVEIGALRRMEARRAPTPGTERPVPAAHAVHVGRGGPDVGEIALESGHLRDALHLGEDRALAA